MMWVTQVIRKIVAGLNPGMKYFPALVRQPNMSKDELERKIAGRSSLTEGDVANVFKNFAFELAEATANGRSVETEIGIFQVQLQVKGSDTLEEVTTDNILKVNIRYIPSKKILSVYKKENNQFTFVDVTLKGHQEKSESGTPETP